MFLQLLISQPRFRLNRTVYFSPDINQFDFNTNLGLSEDSLLSFEPEEF